MLLSKARLIGPLPAIYIGESIIEYKAVRNETFHFRTTILFICHKLFHTFFSHFDVIYDQLLSTRMAT